MRVQLSTEQGGLIETEGFWINLNAQSGMPARITESFEQMLGSTAENKKLRWKPMITETPGENDHNVPFPLRSVDIDLLGHVNNAVYLQAVEDVLTHRPELTAIPTRTAIEYLAPTAPDSDLQLAVRHEDKSFTAWFAIDGKTHAQARVAPLD
ncbi:hypothetical protein GCM10011410_32750 [Hoyosella rhizosphaerae]|uniref:Acyl-ACP thioesterase-like C-terminal domain-containing protein n=2 Tax=Hoyosella rhizosphaerae TaxID=1755582 RepID=A0A916UM13_9ACTN|nr:hypothetical protein GCM10011410_32750 [Hoyosella rhizosphaerae]